MKTHRIITAAAALLVATSLALPVAQARRSEYWATSSAPICCGTISALPDARSSRCSSNSVQA